jgi:hypothetical protein
LVAASGHAAGVTCGIDKAAFPIRHNGGDDADLGVTLKVLDVFEDSKDEDVKIIIWDEKAEDNEIELLEGQIVTDIDMVDEDWWIGTNVKGERGLFPSNYVEVVEESQAPAPAPAPAPRPVPPPVEREPTPPPPPAASRPAAGGPTATALYDYEAAEDNGKSTMYSIFDRGC